MRQRRLAMDSKQAISSRALVATAQRVLLMTHERPDGDGLGSMLGLGWALEAAGKRVDYVDEDGCPANFRFLPGFEKIKSKIPAGAPAGEYDLLIALDTADLHRLGRAGEKLPRPVDINLDHHVTNTHFGRVNLVDLEVASTAEIVLKCLKPWGLELAQETAVCLLAGLLTDTLGFRTSSTTPETLETAAGLMRAGAPLPELLRKSLYSRSYAAARLWGAGLGRLELKGRLIHTSLTLADKQALGYTGRDDADLVNVLTTVEGADVAVIFVEQMSGHTKISWRANPDIDITPVAISFGGGGHAAAAGAEVEGGLQEVRERVLDATKTYLKAQS